MTWPELIGQPLMAHAGNLAKRAERERVLGQIICPDQENIFRALDLTPPDNLKVVILGQDPYHTPGQADGLAFSNPPGNAMQPSLANIMKELADDLGIPEPRTTDLTPWAKQGVLLLNSVLTVYAKRPKSCVDWGWQDFTKAVLEASLRIPRPVVYILWGADARNLYFSAAGDRTNKFVILSSHPSPYSAHNGSSGLPAQLGPQHVQNGQIVHGIPSFFGSRPFSWANQILIQNNVSPVDWRL